MGIRGHGEGRKGNPGTRTRITLLSHSRLLSDKVDRMAGKTSTAVILGLIVGFTWWLCNKITSPLGPITSSFIVGSFAGMLYALADTIFDSMIREWWEFRRQMKEIEKGVKRQTREQQREHQRRMLEERMQQQLSAQTMLSGYGPATVLPQSPQTPERVTQMARTNLPTLPIPGDPDYSISPHQ